MSDATSTLAEEAVAGPAAPSRPETWEEKIARLRRRKPAETWVTVPDVEALRAVDAARQHYIEVRTAARKDLPDAGGMSSDEIAAFLDERDDVKAAFRNVEEAVTTAEELEVTFHLRALPPDVYEALEDAHPPTDEQRSNEFRYNPKTYIPALIAASSVHPLTVEQVEGLMTADDDGNVALNRGDVDALVQACRDLNERPRMMLGKGSRSTGD